VRFAKFNASRCLPKSFWIFLRPPCLSQKTWNIWNKPRKYLIHKAKTCSKSLEQVGTKLKKLEQEKVLTAKFFRVTLGTQRRTKKNEVLGISQTHVASAADRALARAHIWNWFHFALVGAKKSPA